MQFSIKKTVVKLIISSCLEIFKRYAQLLNLEEKGEIAGF